VTIPTASPLPWKLDFVPPAKGLSTAVVYDAAGGRLQVTATNATARSVSPRDLRLVAKVKMPAAAGSAWLHGRYMQMDALVRVFGEPAEEGFDGRYVRPLGKGRRYVSREVVTLNLPSSPSPVLLVGSLRMDRFFLDVEVDVDEGEEHLTGISLVFDLDGLVLGPGESLALPPVLIVDGRDPVALMERYAGEVAGEMNARVPGHVPTGWCSWYYFYNRVSEADVLANLETMVRERHPAEYVQVDDGFQSHTGDWLVPNEKFPSGMKALADRIREAGYRPGLWLAPFVMHEDSAVLRDRPEMALRTREGEILFVETWLGRCAVLDCTHPRSEEWLREVVRTVVSEWGYEYLKLDALAFAARPASGVRYHAPRTTAPANLRRGLEIIREAAGDDTFILGCTCHFGPAIGLVDAMRVGPDVKETWANGPNPSVRHAMRLTLQRNWMHGRWWVNDPDCLIVRETDTELDEAEVRFLATGIALSGGMVVASDDLPKLGPGRRALALALFPPPGVAARPVDPAEGPVPSAWRSDLGEGRSLVGILNWSDEARWVVVNEYLQPGEVAFDTWNGRMLGKGDLLLRPHEGSLWQVSAPGPTPRVVGDTGHVNYHGLYQRPVSGRIQLRNDLSRPRVLAVEARGSVSEVELAPGEMRWFD
jgi:alpha-galactosidase